MEINGLTCSIRSTIRDVLKIIDSNSKRMVFAIDEDDRLIGILTDGDIRRLLLEGYGLNDSIEQHINRRCVYAYANDKPEDILKLFSEDITIIPIIDNERKIVDYSEFNKKMHISLAQPQLNGNEYQYLMDAFLSTWISSAGKYVNMFEKSFANYCGAKYGIATTNGTTALHLALLALDIGEGDEVIVPDLTFAATINAVIYTGATPVIVDIDEKTWCISPEMIKRAITPKTKAVIPVHLYGQPCEMDEICKIARDNDLYVVEDCAEAHGAEYNEKKVGTFGIISCFSFYGNKVITTGEGGMCLTDSCELDMKMRQIRDHGMSKERKYYHEVIGYNYRMTNLQAAIGCAQVEKIDDILLWRERLEKQYKKIFEDVSDIQWQMDENKSKNKITWLISILLPAFVRNKVLDSLKKCEVDVRAFFFPLHTMKIYEKYAIFKYPISSDISSRGINLPTTIDIDEKEIGFIKKIIIDCLK